MKKKIIAIGICAALMGGFGGCNGGENVSGGAASDNVTTAAAETTEDTEASAEATSAAETSETAETTRSTDGLTVSPSGYVLDPNVTLGEKERAWEFPINKPCLIGEPAESVRVYGVNTDTEREWHYLNTVMEQEYFSVTSCVIIEHDDIADEFAGFWGERHGSAMSVYSGDFDGDGVKEIATLRYDTGGTFCCIMELVLYKLNNGHYEQFVFSPQAFNKEYITADIDNENKVLTVSVNGFDKTFTYSFSDVVPPEMTEFKINWAQVNNFILDDGEITYIVTPLLLGYVPETFVNINFKLSFSDGVFTCSDVEFVKNEPYGSADEPEYTVDLDTAVSNIIAAGVEADNSEFILSGMEESDDETYYKIIKVYDNGEAVSTEEIFRVNTENGSVYLYIDPTLPMSEYQAQFRDKFGENDPQSRYIRIYDGKQ